MIIQDKRRFMVSQVFLVLTLIAWLLLVVNNKFIYDSPQTTSAFSNLPRWLWSLAFGLSGFTLAAFFASFDDHFTDHFHKMTNFGFAMAYGGSHFVSTVISSTLVYAVLSVIPSTNGHIYYLFSAAVSLYMGLIADVYLISKLGIKR